MDHINTFAILVSHCKLFSNKFTFLILLEKEKSPIGIFFINPPLRHFARNLALVMVSSPERYKSRRDQQKLTKYLESIEKELFHDFSFDEF